MRKIILASILLAACGDDATPTSPDLSMFTVHMASDMAPITDCDVIAQDCPAGQRCTIVANGNLIGTGCVADTGSVAVGQPCAQAMLGDDNCQKGSLCSQRGWPADASGPQRHCNQLCKADSDCGPGEGCTAETTDSQTGACVKMCTPFGNDCPSGMTCSAPYLDTPSDNQFMINVVMGCRSVVGQATAGDTCSVAAGTDCDATTFCFKGFCSALCDPTHPCSTDGGTSSCALLGNNSTIGVCE